MDVAIYGDYPETQDIVHDVLQRHGAVLKKQFSVSGIGITEESYKLYGIKFDIQYYYRLQDDVDSCFLFMPFNYDDGDVISDLEVKELQCEAIKQTKTLQIHGKMVNVPAYPEKYLEQRYGKTWRQPDKNYKYWMGPSVHPCDRKGTAVFFG